MATAQASPDVAALAMLRRALAHLRDEARSEPWQLEKRPALARLALAELLQSCNATYDSLIRVGEQVSFAMIHGEIPDDPTFDDEVQRLIGEWAVIVRPLGAVVNAAESEWAGNTLIGEFRARIAEAEWLLLSENEKFTHPRMAALRDSALESLRNNSRQ